MSALVFNCITAVQDDPENTRETQKNKNKIISTPHWDAA